MRNSIYTGLFVSIGLLALTSALYWLFGVPAIGKEVGWELSNLTTRQEVEKYLSGWKITASKSVSSLLNPGESADKVAYTRYGVTITVIYNKAHQVTGVRGDGWPD